MREMRLIEHELLGSHSSNNTNFLFCFSGQQRHNSYKAIVVATQIHEKLSRERGGQSRHEKLGRDGWLGRDAWLS